MNRLLPNNHEISGSWVMELGKMKLPKKHKLAVTKIKNILDRGFYLAGGTAIYYYNEEIDLRRVSRIFNQDEIRLISRDAPQVVVEGINVSFFRYLYPLLKPLNDFGHT